MRKKEFADATKLNSAVAKLVYIESKIQSIESSQGSAIYLIYVFTFIAN